MSDWKIVAQDTSYSIDNGNVNAVYRPILVQSDSAPTEQSAVQVGTTKPEEAVNFSLSAQLESGRLRWKAYHKEDRDYAYDPVQDVHTLDELINNSDISLQEEQTLTERFSQNSQGIYTVSTVIEQRIWLKEYIHDWGLRSEAELYGPSWTHRVIVDSGTPIFITSADVEPDPERGLEGDGILSFQLGERL